MYPRNAATPPAVAVGSVVQISDGAVQTTGASVRVKTGAGAWGAGAGTLTCDTTSGIWYYAPTQGETNDESFMVAVYKTACLPCAITVVTSASATTGYSGVDWAKVLSPTSTVSLTGTTIASSQVVASVTGAVGSVGSGGITSASFGSGAITAAAIAADAIGASELAADAVTEIVAAVWAAATRTLTAATNITSTGAAVPIGASGYVQSDLLYINGAALSTSSAQIGVNVVNFGGSAGHFSSGRPEVNVTHWVGGQLTGYYMDMGGTIYPMVHLDDDSFDQVNVEADTALSDYGALQPTVPGRTLDVTTGGAAGMDWGNIENQSTTVTLSGTTVGTVSAVGSGALTSASFAAGAITASAIAADAIGASELAADAATEIATAVWAAATRTLTAFSFAVDLSTTALNDVNAEVDTALGDYDGPTYTEVLNIARLSLRKDAAVATDLASLLTAINTDLGSGVGAYANTTDSQEGLRDRGDLAWITATGFSTHSAADVWAVATRTLTAFSFSVDISATAVDNIWDEALSGHTTSGTAGRYLGTNLPADITALQGTIDSVDGKLDTAQLDLDTITGADGVTLATSQPNYAPSTHSAADVWAVGTRTLTGFSFSVDLSGGAVDAIWDEALAGHAVSGSTGEALSAAGTAGDPWTTLLPGSYTAGQAGYILGTYLDAAVSSRSTVAATDIVTGGAITTSGGRASANTVYWNGAPVSTPSVAGVPRVDVHYWAGGLMTEIGIGAGGGPVPAVILSTSEDGSGLDAQPWNSAWDAEVQSEVADALTAYDAATGTDISDLQTHGDSTWSTATGFSTHTAADVWAVATRTLTAFAFSVDLSAGAVDDIWDELLSGHATSGTAGLALSGAGAGGDPWNVDPSTYPAGTTGYIIYNNLDAPVSDAALQTTLSATALLVAGLDADWDVGGRLEAQLDAAATALTTPVTESYAAKGAAPTPIQALLGILQLLTEAAIDGNDLVIKALDGLTTAMRLSTDDIANPQVRTRSA